MTKNLVSVVIPFLNEEDNIPNLVNTLNIYFKNKDFDANVLFVDDGSTDNSIVVLKEQQFVNYKPKLVKLSKNYGSHLAVRAGIQQCEAGFCIILPADLQDPLSLIDVCYLKLKENNSDIVFANRKVIENNRIDNLFTSLYSKLMIKFVDYNYPKKGFDVVFFNDKIIKALNNEIEKNSSLFLQILSLGFKQDFIEYDKVERKHGKSKWTINKKIKLLVDSFVAFSFAPIRLVTIVGITLFAGGVLFSFYLLVRKFLFHDLVSGWTMLMTTLSLGFGITNISLGIIAEYLWRTFDAARGRPAFIIDEIIDLKNE
jgi:polyisoprenyl-phosphate glycosyltransferase